MIDTKYLRFVRSEINGRKTSTVNVISVHSGELLATIKWFGRWRQYALFPEAGTVWNPECLDDVNKIIKALMAERTSGKIERT